MRKHLLFLIFLSAVSAFALNARAATPSSCNCAGGTESVVCFGAIPNDDLGDSAAIQTAINSVPDTCNIYFPTGEYEIDATLYNNRNNITLIGDGVGSVLYTEPGTNHFILQMPESGHEGNCNQRTVPKNIVITNLAFDGRRNYGIPGVCHLDGTGGDTCPRLNAIQITQGEDISIKEVLFRDFGLEAVGVAVGIFSPKNITLWRVRTQRIRRNALHLGNGENLRIKDSIIEDSQSPRWEGVPQSGNSIDVEVEGLATICEPKPANRDPYVYNSSIENTLIISDTSNISSGGVSLAPAFGPIRKFAFRNNVMVNTKGFVSYGKDLTSGLFGVDPKIGNSRRNRELDISSNWIANLHQQGVPPADDFLSGITIYGSGAADDTFGNNGITLNNNVITSRIPTSAHWSFQFAGVKYLTGENNRTYRPPGPTSDPVNNPFNFLWRLGNLDGLTDYGVSHMRLLNTYDSGAVDSRLLCYNPAANPILSYCDLSGLNSSMTFQSMAEAPLMNQRPVINSVQLVNRARLLIKASDPNEMPMRVAVLHNDLPVTVRDLPGVGFISLGRKVRPGDTVEVRLYNHNGLSDTEIIQY